MKKLKNKNNPLKLQAGNDLEKNIQFVEAGIDSEFKLIEAAKDSDSKQGKFSLVAYTGGKIRQGFAAYPIVVDLSGMKVTAKSRPILRDHQSSQIVGHTELVQINNSRINVTGFISAANEHSREVAESAKNGFPWQASIGAEIVALVFVDKGEKVQVNGKSFTGPIYVVRKSILKEISFVALGADDNTSAKVAATLLEGNSKMNEFDKWLEAAGFVKEDLTEGQLKALQAQFDSVQNTDGGGDDEGDDGSQSVQASAATVTATSTEQVAQVQADIRAGAASEMNRINAINALDYNNSEIKAKAISEEWDVQKTELELLRADRSSGVSIHTSKSKSKSKDVIEAALLLTAGVDESKIGEWMSDETVEAALSNDMRGYSIQALLHEVVHAAGGSTRIGMSVDSLITAAADAERNIKASGGASTISLSGILSNIANKVSLASFMAVKRTTDRFCSSATMSDFKTHTSYRLTSAGRLEKVGPDGELKHGELSEESFTNKLETYGKMFGLNRQQIYNDDLGEFLKIPKFIGRQGALAVERETYVLLLSNPNSFFSTGNKNYFEGADTNLQISSLGTAEQMFEDQVDESGEPIILNPSIMLVPTSEKTNAGQIYKDTHVNETTSANKPKTTSNPHAGKFEPTSSAFLNAQALTGSSSTAWYLFADPNDVAAMEIGYLNGRKIPYIESEVAPFDKLGIQFRGYFDFGVAMKDHRAAVMSKGKA